MNYIKSNLIYLRNKDRYTSKEAAYVIGVNIASYSAWLSGRAIPQTADFKKISDAFEVSIEFFVLHNLSEKTNHEIQYNYYETQLALKRK